MSHYARRLEADIVTLRAAVADIGARVEANVGRSVRAVLTGDHALANDVILSDLAINRDVRETDRRCHAFVARHLPSAGPLRFVSSVLRLDVGLERVGDYAVTIAREAVQLRAPVPTDMARRLATMDSQARLMLRQAMQSWVEGSADLARGTKSMAGSFDVSLGSEFDTLVALGQGDDGHPLADLFALLIVFNRLERVSDQAKNICEETVFHVTGQTKAPKVYKVLFVDEENTGPSLLAQAVARRAFPESGHFQSAGFRPGAAVDPAYAAVLEARGLDDEDLVPGGIPAGPTDLDPFHVIVGLDCDPRAHIPNIPFHMVVLRWDKESEAPAEHVQGLAAEIGILMERLRGPDAC